MKLLVRNLARTTTESELQSLFEPFGTVQSCNLVMDKVSGSSKGFGFVEMPKTGEAKAAMKTLNGQDIAGNKIRVKKTDEKSAEENTVEEKPVEDKSTNESVWATTKTHSQSRGKNQSQNQNQSQAQPAANPWGRSDNNTDK